MFIPHCLLVPAYINSRKEGRLNENGICSRIHGDFDPVMLCSVLTLLLQRMLFISLTCRCVFITPVHRPPPSVPLKTKKNRTKPGDHPKLFEGSLEDYVNVSRSI